MNEKRALKQNRSHAPGAAARFAAALIAASLLLSGCSLPGFLQRKPTAVSLAKSAAENVQKAESAAADMDLDLEVSINYDQLNIGMKMDVNADLDMEMTKDPQLAKGTENIAIGIMGQTQNLQGVFYLDARDGKETTYMKWNDGKWSKKTGQSESGSEDESTAGSGTSLLQTVGIVKLIAEEAVGAELLEETATVNDKEAYQINCTLTGEFLKTMWETYGGSAGSGSAFDLSQIDWNGVEIPARLYVYKESRYPARISMDCQTIGGQLAQNMLGDSLESLPVGSIGVDVDRCNVDITLDRYNEISEIEIPQEALQAEETDELTPAITDLLGL